MISLGKVTKLYGNTPALDNVTTEFCANRVTGLLGQNGAGKTTTIKLINGYLKPDIGEVKTFGLNPASSDMSKIVGYLPESSSVYLNLTVMENLEFFASMHGVPKSQKKSKIERVIELLELDEVTKKLAKNLSKGFKQRLAIAASISHDPDIVILDEPTSGLDPVQIVHIRKIISDLKKEGKTIIISTHVLQEVSQTCDDVVILKNGNLVTKQDLSEVDDVEQFFYQTLFGTEAKNV